MIFDLDGVLADSHPVHEAAWTALLREAGQPPPAGFREYLREGRTRTEMLHHFFPDQSAAELAKWSRRKQELYDVHRRALQPVPGVLGLVRALYAEEIVMAVATCAGRQRTQETLCAFGVEKVFAAVVTSDDVIRGKPDPMLFLLAAERLKVTPAEALVIEDSVSGVTAAKKAGMYCVAYCAGLRAESLRKAGADEVIHDFATAAPSLLAWGQQSLA